jgi:hypothetical protein
MIIRENTDIGYVVVGDTHKKSSCAHIRIVDVVDVLGGVRRTQLGLLYNALKLQEPTDDIVDDLPVMQTLFGEFIPPTVATLASFSPLSSIAFQL